MKKYTLEINEKQAETIKSALEVFSRIGIGQFEYALDEVWLCSTPNANRKEIHNLCELLKKEYTGLSEGVYGSIYNKDINDRVQVAYDIYQVLRHRLSWDKEPKGGYFCRFDKPLKASSEELPKISEAKEK